MPSESIRAIAVADVGGTHARFAVARLGGQNGIALDDLVTFKTADFAGLHAAWSAYVERLGWKPDAAAIAVAAPIDHETISFTNSHWNFGRRQLADLLGLRHSLLVNDFVAVGHAIAVLGDEHLRPLCGINEPRASPRSITVVGPGTGLGTARIIRTGERYQVYGAEGGHIAFAPLDEVEDAILHRLRTRYGRVSVERVVSGHGLAEIYAILAAREPACELGWSDDVLWTRALSGSDPLASAALHRLCACFGGIAGDLALASGADALVIAGGLGLRLVDHLPGSAFMERFRDKGRMSRNMEDVPVSVLTFAQAGLLGAAAAFAEAEREPGSEL